MLLRFQCAFLSAPETPLPVVCRKSRALALQQVLLASQWQLPAGQSWPASFRPAWSLDTPAKFYDIPRASALSTEV